METTSFVQNQKHVSKSDRFTAIQPAQFATVLGDHGFSMVHLKTGKAKQMDKVDHQTTIARYRSVSALSIDGLFPDILIKAPHLYGAIEIRLGFFRMSCANQWNMGNLFSTYKIRHSSDFLDRVAEIMPVLISQQSLLTENVKALQAHKVTGSQLLDLAKSITSNRLIGVENVSKVFVEDLLMPRRANDNADDAFSVVNVLQENVMRHGFRYNITTVDNNVPNVRHMHTRPILDTTARSITTNASIWDSAMSLLNA